LAIYFAQFVLPKKRKAIIIPEKLLLPSLPTVQKKGAVLKKDKKEADEKFKEEEGVVLKERKPFDIDRRMFLKIIGSSGLAIFVFSIFSKKAEGTFFGSVPGPGTVALKDIAGNKIDPAIKTPTDGYKVTEIDDSSAVTYIGFLDKTGKWYIMQDTDGSYRYVKGDSSFASNWNTRATREDYDYFDTIFGS